MGKMGPKVDKKALSLKKTEFVKSLIIENLKEVKNEKEIWNFINMRS